MVVETMKDIFLKCQDNSHNHPELLKKLKKLFEKKDIEDFWGDFQHLLKYILVIFKREPTVERCVDFICKFASSLNKESDDGKENEAENTESVGSIFLEKLFDFLLMCHAVADKAVRFRACQLIYRVLEYLGDDTEIDDDLYDRIHDCMMERMKDEVPAVRVNAVLALKRLQDPRNKDCPIIKAYSFLINHDPIMEVRKAVLSSIAPTLKTLPLIVERTRDVSDHVRSMAYLVLAEKVHIKALSIAQRLQLLQDGLNDRAVSVQDACKKKLLYAWLQNVGGKMLSLLESLDVDDSADVCVAMLKTFYKSITITEFIQSFDTLNEELVIEYDKLTLENVFYWQTLCQHTKSLGNSYEENLEQILPDTMKFCKYIRGFVETMHDLEDLELLVEKEFILQQLLIMTKCLDVTDQVQRKEVEKLLHDLLLSDHISDRIVKNIIPRLVELKGNNEQFVTFMAETISDIRMPVTVVDKAVSEEDERQKNIKIAGIRVKLNQRREELDECIQNQEFSRAAEIKTVITELEEEREKIQQASQTEQEEVRNEKTDPQTILKCLSIICEMLKELTSLKSISPTLQAMVETQIFPGIQNQEASVREMAVLDLGLCCLLNRDLGQQNLPLLMEVIQVDVEFVRIAALKVIFDLLHFYGLEIVAFDDNTTRNQTNTNNNNTTMSDETVDSTRTDTMEYSQNDAEEDEGSETANSQDSDTTKSISSEAATKLVAIIVKYLDSENASARTVAAEGLSKLLLSRRVVSAKILSHLILTWYNPLTKDDTHLRACLGDFFPIFSFAASVNQELVADSFLPTLRTILDAPSSSPISEINVNNIADLLVQLTNSKRLMHSHNSTTSSMKDNPGHDSIAMKVCNEFLCRPNFCNHGLWTRILNQLDISVDNTTVLKDLNNLCTQIEKVDMADLLGERLIPLRYGGMAQKIIKDKNINKSFKRFLTKVEEMMKSLNMSLPEEKSDEVETADSTKIEEDRITELEADDLFQDTPSKEKRHTRRLLSTTMSMADNSEIFEGSLLSQSMDGTGKHMKDILDEINEVEEFSSGTSQTTTDEEKISEASSPEKSITTNARKANTRNLRKVAPVSAEMCSIPESQSPVVKSEDNSGDELEDNETVSEHTSAEKSVAPARQSRRNAGKKHENLVDESNAEPSPTEDSCSEKMTDSESTVNDLASDHDQPSVRQSKRNAKKTGKNSTGELSSEFANVSENSTCANSSDKESVSSDKCSTSTRQSKRNAKKTVKLSVEETASEENSVETETSDISESASVSSEKSRTSTRQSKRNTRKMKADEPSSDYVTATDENYSEIFADSESVVSESATSETSTSTRHSRRNAKKANEISANGFSDVADTSEADQPDSASFTSETDGLDSASTVSETTNSTQDTVDEVFTSSKKKAVDKENGTGDAEGPRKSKRNTTTRTTTTRTTRNKTSASAAESKSQIVDTPKKSPVRNTRTSRSQKKGETEPSSTQETPTKRSLRSAKPLKNKN